MIRARSTFDGPVLWVLLALLVLPGGCGWVGVDGSGRDRPTVSRAPHPSRTMPPAKKTAVNPPAVKFPSVKPPSARVFVGADAVIAGRGDTVYALARRHNVSPRAIIQANGLRPPYHLRVGQRIVLPRERTHAVAQGETLYGISRRYAVDTYTIARANGLSPPYVIVAGQSLRIPGPETMTAKPAPAKRRHQVSAALKPQPAPKAVPVKKPKKAAPVPKPPPRSGSGFIWPVEGKVLSSFGPKKNGLHNDGLNIAAHRGTAVRAAESGVVAYAGNELRGFGNLLLIKHSGGWVTAYAHNDTLLVRRGDRVKRGQVISKVGSTGGVTRPQLHFELRKGSSAVDPRRHLKRARV